MEIVNNRLLLGNVVVENLVEKYGSPLFVYEAAVIRERYLKLRESIRYPKLQIFYSCKANSNIAILQLLRKLGAAVQVASPAEVYLAHKAGFSSFNIIHASSSPGMSEVAYVIDRNIRVTIDSLTLLRQYGERYRGTGVYLRLNPELTKTVKNPAKKGQKQDADDPGTVVRIPAKTGIPASALEEVRKILAEYRLSLNGLHVHLSPGSRVGSFVVDCLARMLEWAEAFDTVELCDIGGGIGSLIENDEELDTLEHLAETLVKRMQQFTGKTNRTLTLAIEPGHYLVGEAGYLVSTVNALTNDGIHEYAGLDTGINHYTHNHPDQKRRQVFKTARFDLPPRPYVLAGNLNEERDVFFREGDVNTPVELPALAAGDLLVFSGVGTYAFSLASPYCGRLLPAEVLVDDGRDRLVRGRQNFEDLSRNQTY